MLQNDAWLQPALAKPPHVDQLLIVCALPLYHIFALTACFLLARARRRRQSADSQSARHPGFVKELTKYQINNFPAVNTLYNALLHHPDFNKVDFSSSRSPIGGGMAVQRRSPSNGRR